MEGGKEGKSEDFYGGNIHESIVNGNDEDLAGALDLRVCDEAGDVGVRASWALSETS